MRVFQFSFHIIKQLKFPLRVLSTTMNYYQRFYLFNRFQASEEAQDIGDLERDPFMVAVACLFLAAKNEDCIKKLKEIQSVANKLRDIDDTQRISSSTVADLQRRAVMSLEFKLLQIIKFDFNNGATVSIKSSDQLVTQFCKKLNINYRLSLFSWLINFDLMSSPLCLVIPPHCIALAIIIINEESDEELNAKLDSFDCYVDFRCPESLVNEGILYVLDYYIHSYQHSILNQYLPAIDRETGKEQIFKFMEFKSRFNDLKTLNEHSTATRPLLQQDKYLQPWDYSIATKGTARFMPGNKRRRFSRESGKPRQMSNS
ncbi:RNA polymerase II C-terminal domain kinase beta subunit [Scheffersomyces stipitis CBS 6054]|uniref:RNA polymerase II C-terminal domain kinase beta subunit n=1 Tax=Scheffersomyces stipitis (strain ATCC 58785 / CBS 6054 / NBRC 10063 / NRRL Y-11545) TaxID=322104 RepID=A3LXF5_PICST|nr:RNA polymerase II C-terminal domain kinase beta subunit [Scheffersomyces stipitis CBS 6054]ABN67447.2 RNA polymerase II C-terminal domain kinase beta subunit [Scheffersomyces stipitis CBS 6054]